MGWLYMKSLRGQAGPSEYLDVQFTFERPEGTSKVLRSELIGKTYYAAVEQRRRDDGEREVFALICLVAYDPLDSEGYIFGYKDMSEHMGPYECHCPEGFLDLLTPTDRPYAKSWRARCHANAASRRAAGGGTTSKAALSSA